MISANLGAFGDGAATLAGYATWNERLCKQLCLTIENLDDAGFAFQKADSTDLSAAETTFNSMIDYTKSWYDSNVDASAAGESITAYSKSYIPELVSLAAFVLTGNWGAVFVLFVKVGLEVVLDSTEKKLDPDVSTGDLAEILKQTLALTDEDGNIIGSRVDMLRDLSITINNQLEEIQERWSTDS